MSALSDDELVALIGKTSSSAKTTKVSTHDVFERLTTVSDLLAELPKQPNTAALVYRDPNSGAVNWKAIGERLTVGRSRNRDANLQITDEEMSRRHFEIMHVGDNVYTINDLGSTNGLYLNGLQAKTEFLVSGTEIRAGRTDFVFVGA
ncbi:MAG: FHA domain-containing protein [Verrucomicrobia bacterium]|nr:FHA domain-containing protein [Verrucomicrobiota bacterium]